MMNIAQVKRALAVQEVVEAIGTLVEAKIAYERSYNRDPEWANPAHVDAASKSLDMALAALIGGVP